MIGIERSARVKTLDGMAVRCFRARRHSPHSEVMIVGTEEPSS
jgi:hypothetical protein